MVTPMPQDLVSTTEAAGIIGVSPSQVNRLAASGALPIAHKGNGPKGPRFYTRSVVERYAANRKARILAGLGVAS
jgi:phage terminase Nu1 subunit (DNA packaging protein)